MIPCLLVNVDAPTKVSKQNDDLIYDSDGSQAFTDKSYNPKTEDQLSELEQRFRYVVDFFS